jgi:malonate transporter
VQLFRVPGNWTAVAVLLAACPSGINAYLFANRYRVVVASTATVVVVSTLVSVAVLSFGLAYLIPLYHRMP